MLKYLPICAALLLLAGCENDRDPGFICMTNCAHECQDGIKGDSCRADMQKQRDDRDGQYDTRYHDRYDDHYYDNGRSYDNDRYYDNNGYPNGDSYPNDGGYHSRY